MYLRSFRNGYVRTRQHKMIQLYLAIFLDFRSSKLSLSKLKEKASPDGAHEKLLNKEDEAKIVRDMRVDIVDAKFVSGDHRNGDPKIELDANKRQFSGLTKEELMKYADDPFWVNLRWFMFVLFWALWLGMLAGAIAIIVNAPKCGPPTPKKWFEKGPLVELASQENAEEQLALLQSSKVQGIFISVPTYEALDNPDVLEKFKAFVEKAKKYSIKVIVDLIPNYVSKEHVWFQKSLNNNTEYHDYFVWADVKDFDDKTNDPKPPNNWVSTKNESAWKYDADHQQFYLHQFGADQPDLDFNNRKVVELFTTALKKWMASGADGVRLNNARLMLVNTTSLHKSDESPAQGKGAAMDAGHDHYSYYRHRHTADQPGLDPLLTELAAAVAAAATPREPEETVFTLKEDDRPELFMLEHNVTLRPASGAPIAVDNATAAAIQINKRIDGRWPIIQLKPSDDPELASFALLLPAAPVFDVTQLDNETDSDSLSHLVSLRDDASVEHGQHAVAAVPGLAADTNTTAALLACARWKAGHTGYVAVYNPSEEHVRANLTSLPAVPALLTVHHASHQVLHITNYTKSPEPSESVLVPSRSTIVFSYVPLTTAEN